MTTKQHVAATSGDRRFGTQEMRNFLHMRLEVPALVRALRLPSGCDVLETGCGGGIGLTALAATCRPASLTGVDIDDDLLEQARTRFSSRGIAANFVHGDIRELPFPDESFDLVVDFGTLYHVQPARQAIDEIARVLRVGGILVYETLLSQLLAHPLASSRRRLPWYAVPQLAPLRNAGLWACCTKKIRPVQR